MTRSESSAALLAAAPSLPLHKYIEIHLKSKFFAPTVLAIFSHSWPIRLSLFFCQVSSPGLHRFSSFPPLSSPHQFLVNLFLLGLCFDNWSKLLSFSSHILHWLSVYLLSISLYFALTSVFWSRIVHALVLTVLALFMQWCYCSSSNTMFLLCI